MNDTFLEEIDKKFDNNEQKINCICTLLGCSARLVEHLYENGDLKNLSAEMKYLLAVLASQVIGLTQDAKPRQKDISSKTKDYFLGEQQQETIYRVMKEVVTELYESIQEQDDV